MSIAPGTSSCKGKDVLHKVAATVEAASLTAKMPQGFEQESQGSSGRIAFPENSPHGDLGLALAERRRLFLLLAFLKGPLTAGKVVQHYFCLSGIELKHNLNKSFLLESEGQIWPQGAAVRPILGTDHSRRRAKRDAAGHFPGHRKGPWRRAARYLEQVKQIPGPLGKSHSSATGFNPQFKALRRQVMRRAMA